MELYERIPNNVNLSVDKRLQRALEKWLPNYLDWWREMGPEGFQEKDVWLRTAVSVEPEGWANFGFDAHSRAQRSEEHTSELQSRQYLVCRLLLEKNTTDK